MGLHCDYSSLSGCFRFYLFDNAPWYALFVGLSFLTVLPEILPPHSLCYFCGYEVYFTCCRYGDWAVVTGATDGIGRAFTVQLARQRINVVIVGRTKSKLEELSKELSSKYGIEVCCILHHQSHFNSHILFTHYQILSRKLNLLGSNFTVVQIGSFLPVIQYKKVHEVHLS